MRKIILQEWISLDGYVADKNGQLDFFTSFDSTANKYFDLDQLKFMDEIDTILLGRKTYELFVDFWPQATTETEVIADKLNSTHKLIFSNTLQQAPWGKWPAAEVISGEATDRIRKLKNREGKNMVIWGSISLAQALMKERLIDEYHLNLCPTITGGGRPLFQQDHHYMNMQLADFRKYETGVMFLRYITG
jgi:dihydrofolate reductase